MPTGGWRAEIVSINNKPEVPSHPPLGGPIVMKWAQQHSEKAAYDDTMPPSITNLLHQVLIR